MMASTLRLLQQVFVGSNQNTKEQKQDNASHCTNLPTELWLLIISYINERTDLSVLCRSSKRFRDMIECTWYTSISITTVKDLHPGNSLVLDERRRTQILQTLLSPRIANFVTEFRIRLPWCPGPSKLFQSLLLVDRCMCKDVDTRLGKALKGLPHLQVLEIRCFLCDDAEDLRHTYLENLATTGLRELHLQCRCSHSGTKKSQLILSAPCMASVTTLDWRTASGRVQSQTFNQDDKTYREVLPLLTKLRYGRTADLEVIVGTRPITHLGCHTMKDGIHNSLSTNKRRLVRLRVDETWSNMIFYLQRDPDPYRSLKHFGYFHFVGSKSETILQHLLPFVALPELESIEVFNHTVKQHTEAERGHGQPWDSVLLVKLQKQHHALKKVYIKELLHMSKLTGEMCDFILWERHASWKKYEIAPFTDWDMVVGFEPRRLH